DLVDQPQRVVERQQVDHRPESEAFGALCHRRQEQAGRRRVAAWRVVVLGQVIAVEAGAVVGLDQPEPLLEMTGERQAAVVEVVEDPEAHARPPRLDRSFPRKREPRGVKVSRSPWIPAFAGMTIKIKSRTTSCR